VTVHRELLLETDAPILDAAPLADGRLLVLGAGDAALYHRGRRAGGVAIPHATPWPRDLRGRIEILQDGFRAWLPGVVCRGRIDSELAVECKDADEDWPVGVAGARLVPGRNYFQHAALVPFFSVARLSAALVAAGLDGRAKLYTPALAPGGDIDGMGSELAAVEAACAPGGIVLATGDTDATSVRPFEVSAGRAVAAGDAVGFPGPLAALWPATGGAATAISRHPGTGRYAAFRLTVTCSTQ
jgi:hypothetical protein